MQDRRLVPQAAALVSGRIWAALVSVAIVPLAARSLAPSELVVWLLLSVTANLLGIADLGIGAGVLTRVSKAAAEGDHHVMRRVVATAVAVTSIIGAVIVAAGFAVAAAGSASGILGVHPTQPGADRAAIAFAVCVGLGVPLSIGPRALQAVNDSRGVATAVFSTNTVQLLLAAVASVAGAGLVPFVLISAGLAPATGAACFRRLHTVHGFGYFTVADVDRRVAASLLRSGAAFSAIAVAGALGFEADGLVVSHALSQRTTTSFLLAARILLFIPGLVSVATMPLWAEVGRLVTVGRGTRLVQLLQRAMTLAALGGGLAGVITAAALPWILKVAAPTANAPSWTVRGALVLAVLTLAASAPLAAFLAGMSLEWLQAWSAILMAIVNLAVSLVLVRTSLGAAGPPLATFVAQGGLTLLPMTVLVARRASRLASPPSVA